MDCSAIYARPCVVAQSDRGAPDIHTLETAGDGFLFGVSKGTACHLCMS